MATRSTSKRPKIRELDQNIDESAESDNDGSISPPINNKSSPQRSVVRKTKTPRKSTRPKTKDDQEIIDVEGDETDETDEPFPDGKVSTVEAIDAEAAKFFAYGLIKTNCGGKGRKKKPTTKKRDRAEEASKIKTPQLSIDRVRELFDKDGELTTYMEETCAKKSFDKWALLLSEGFNLLIHGFGSKLNLLENFRRSQLSEIGYTHFVVHGYRPESNLIKTLLETIRREFDLVLPEKSKHLGQRIGSVQRAVEICEAIKRRGAENYDEDADEEEEAADFVILIHSIDGIGLRDDESQTALSYLASSPYCRIVATCDHVNASILWDRSKMNRFQWFNIEATTFANYRREIECQGSKILGLGKRGGAIDSSHTLDGLKSIWSSLNTNSRSVFVLLAKRQLIKKKGAGRYANLLTFSELFDECRDGFISSSETALKQLLVEFQDHHLVKTRFNADEQEVLHLNVVNELLVEFLEKVAGVQMKASDGALDEPGASASSSTIDDPMENDDEEEDDDDDEEDGESESSEEEDGDSEEYDDALDEVLP